MNWNHALIKPLLTVLVVSLLPSLCLAQKPAPVSSSPVVFEIVTEVWGMIEDDTCRRRLIFRLYSSGRIEYERCLIKQTESGRSASSLVRKETRVEEKNVTEFINLVEESDFLKDRRGHPFHSGFSGIDVGWNMTLMYFKDGLARKVLVRNYLPDRASIPDWLHKIIKMAGDLKGEHTI